MVEAAAVVAEEEHDAAVREYDDVRDRSGVEEVERECEVGSSGGGGGEMCLFTDLLGDPLCRIRNSPDFLMLVRKCVYRYTHERTLGTPTGCVFRSYTVYPFCFFPPLV